MTKNEAHCFLWHEAIAGRGSNEITTWIFDFIKGNCQDREEVIVYSDNCVSQNKNKYLFSMYLYCVEMMNIKQITHKYLIEGHTENEAVSNGR